MTHWPILPVLLPLFAGAVLSMLPRERTGSARSVSLAAVLAQIPLAVLLMMQACAGTSVYAPGNWMPPFGIVLVVDRLAALMLLVTSVLASAALLYALRGDDTRGRGFHALFQFQIMGINGAFLTGDLFNLFVFFEVLLMASYGLILHGAGPNRVRAGLHYVLINILGSALFLLALGTIYGVSGTLNMADLALRVPRLSAQDAPLLGAAGLLLLLVFCIKAAAFPLYFWLPRAYASATAPAAALFAIMTKVGIYAVLRVSTLIFGPDAGELAGLAENWLWIAALITVILGAIGALAARELEILIAYLVLVSVGTLLAGVSLGTPAALTATLYYLIHSTWIAGALFLMAGILTKMRGPEIACRLIPGPPLSCPMLTGGLFFVAALSVAGLPPFSGFIGKLLLLAAAGISASAVWLYGTVLGGSLLTLMALTRAGSTLFWRRDAALAPSAPADKIQLTAPILLLIAGIGLMILAGPILDYLNATAAELTDPAEYIRAVLTFAPVKPGGAP